MKLNNEAKVRRYELRQAGVPRSSLSKQFEVAESRLKYIVRLIDRYGGGIVQKKMTTYYKLSNIIYAMGNEIDLIAVGDGLFLSLTL